jgi:hypothetical protein
LLEAIDVLKPVQGLSFVYFDEGDVVRHHLVQRIIRAYDEHKNRIAEDQMSLTLEAKTASEGKAAETRVLEQRPAATGTPAAGSVAPGFTTDAMPRTRSEE